LLFAVSSFCATFFLLSPSTLVHHFLSPFLHFLSVNLLRFLHPLFICMITFPLIVTSVALMPAVYVATMLAPAVGSWKFRKACSHVTYVPVLNIRSLEVHPNNI
jgi:hypothetical protein